MAYNSSNMKIEPTTLGTEPVDLRVLSPISADPSNNNRTKIFNNIKRFIDFNSINSDLIKFADLFNSYATKKTFVTAFFNIALIGKNKR